MFRGYQDSLSSTRDKSSQNKSWFFCPYLEIMRCTGDESILALIGQAMEYVLEMIMSPFWREVKWRECGGTGVSAVTGTTEGVHRGRRVSSWASPKDEESRTGENYTCAKLYCELTMKMVRKQAILFVKNTVWRFCLKERLNWSCQHLLDFDNPVEEKF